MNLCPECRAGKRYIDTEQLQEFVTMVRLEHTCERCGYTTEERVRI